MMIGNEGWKAEGSNEMWRKEQAWKGKRDDEEQGQWRGRRRTWKGVLWKTHARRPAVQRAASRNTTTNFEQRITHFLLSTSGMEPLMRYPEREREREVWRAFVAPSL